MKVLITCGPTWVKLDEVRIISNQSTGEMGHLLAKYFQSKNAKVTLLEGPVRDNYKAKGKVIKYKFFNELAETLKLECLKKYDVIIHAAAVSDFRPKQMLKKKLNSGRVFNLKLVPTRKIINDIKKLSPKTILVGFKLEDSLKTAVSMSKRLFADANCDLVVANTNQKGYEGLIIDSNRKILARASSKSEIAQALVQILRP